MKRNIFIILYLLIPLFLIYPGFSNFILPLGSSYTDLLISHYPNLLFLKNALINDGSIPLWSNAILGGYPFYANPLSGLWYPFTWILLLLPQPFGYSLIFLLHLFAGGLGVFLCLKLLGKNDYGALIGALIFELMPKMYAHFASGHVTLLFAVCITPWLVYVELRRSRYKQQRPQFMPGIILAMIALADVRWTPFAFLLWASFSTYMFLENSDLPKKRREWFIKSRLAGLLKHLCQVGIQMIIAIGIAAPIIFPMLQYSALSSRNNLAVSDRLFLSLPPLRFLGLIFPDLGGNCEFVVYPGILAMCAFLYVIINKETRKQQGFWVLILLLSFAYALGANNPLMPLISSLPGFNILRVPTRVLFIGGIAFAMVSGAFIHNLTTKIKYSSAFKLIMVAVCGFSMLLYSGLVVQTKNLNLEFLWGGLFLLAFTIFILFSPVLNKYPMGFTGIITVLLLIDLGVVNLVGFNIQSIKSQMDIKSQAAEWLASDEELFRIYSPSYSIPQQVSAKFKLEMADGIDPLQLQSYVSFMQPATGVPWNGYSVTLPPFGGGVPESDNSQYVPDPTLLGYLNVKFLASEFDIVSPELILVKEVDGTRIYQNLRALPRVWIQNGYELGLPIRFEAHILEYQANKISIKTTQPGVLVTSELNYPGWIVKVDGQKKTLKTIGGIFRGVDLQAGDHTVEFEFKPKMLLWGMIAMIFTITVILFWSFVVANHRNKGIHEEY